MSYTISYITLEQLMASVESDLHSYADNGLIDYSRIIKVVRNVNSDLGLKINREKQCVLEVKNHKADLPTDFYRLQLAFLCEGETFAHGLGEILGTVSQTWSGENVPNDVKRCGNAFLNMCGECVWVTQLYKEKIVRYKELLPVRLTPRSSVWCDGQCPNLTNRSAVEIDIENGELVTTIREGKIYLNYLSDMVDSDGGVIILDHPLVRPYYEYAIKKHLLEGWMLNNDADVAQKLVYINQQLKEARGEAISFISVTEPSVIQKTFAENRRRFYNRFMSKFE